MRNYLVIAALLATGANAQVLDTVGGGVTGTVGTTVAPPATGPVTSTVRDTTRATRETARATVAERDRNAVRVEVGASTRVDRGTRCYYDDYYYDSVYRDGYYYCERSGTRTDASVKAGVPR